MRTSNPVLSDKRFDAVSVARGDATMTVDGTIHRTGLLMIVLTVTAIWTWTRFRSGGVEAVMPLAGLGLFGGLILALVCCFKPKACPILSPVYAALEGLFIGGISAIMEAQFPGIVLQAIGLTLGVFFVMLALYRFRIIRVTKTFAAIVVGATGAVFLLYMVSLVMNYFGSGIGFIHSAGPVGIGFSVFVVILAALNLALDFAFIEAGAKQNNPKYMEWYGAFGLIVTLVWLYIELLRLLSKLRR